MVISRSILLRNIHVSHKRYTENKFKRFMFKNVFPQIVPFYQVMWKNMVQPDRPQMKMRNVCWITKATKHAFRICITHCFLATTMVAWTRLIVTLYVHCLSCIYLMLPLFDLVFFCSIFFIIYLQFLSPTQR